jgi:hypothetical protein
MINSVFGATQWSMKRSKLAVLVPCRDMIHTAFAKCIGELIKFNLQLNIDTHVIYDTSTVLLTQRERLATEALNVGSEFCLWLDSDMAFPPTTAMRLLAHNKDIVAANYVRRQPPFKGVAYPVIGDWQNPLPYEVQDQLAEVAGVGMGCMLMRTKIFTELPKPWFEFQYTPDSNDHLGEDMILCNKITNAGYKIYVDTVLSMETRHMGTWAFGPDLIE